MLGAGREMNLPTGDGVTTNPNAATDLDSLIDRLTKDGVLSEPDQTERAPIDTRRQVQATGSVSGLIEEMRN
jgi:hypothetical protein